MRLSFSRRRRLHTHCRRAPTVRPRRCLRRRAHLGRPCPPCTPPPPAVAALPGLQKRCIAPAVVRAWAMMCRRGASEPRRLGPVSARPGIWNVLAPPPLVAARFGRLGQPAPNGESASSLAAPPRSAAGDLLPLPGYACLPACPRPRRPRCAALRRTNPP